MADELKSLAESIRQQIENSKRLIEALKDLAGAVKGKKSPDESLSFPTEEESEKGPGDVAPNKATDETFSGIADAVTAAVGALGDKLVLAVTDAIKQGLKDMASAVSQEIRTQREAKLEKPEEIAREMARTQATAGVAVTDADYARFTIAARSMTMAQDEARKTGDMFFAGEGSLLSASSTYRWAARKATDINQDFGSIVSEMQTTGLHERLDAYNERRNRDLVENYRRTGE